MLVAIVVIIVIATVGIPAVVYNNLTNRKGCDELTSFGIGLRMLVLYYTIMIVAKLTLAATTI